MATPFSQVEALGWWVTIKQLQMFGEETYTLNIYSLLAHSFTSIKTEELNRVLEIAAKIAIAHACKHP